MQLIFWHDFYSMKRTPLSDRPCSIARTVDVIGEWWTPLILRDLMRGNRRFDGLLESLNISRNILTDRLKTLVNEGVVARHRYQSNPDRYEYILTSKGEDLFPVLVTIMGWGDKWTDADCGQQVKLRHVNCGEIIRPIVVCSCCKQELRLHDARIANPESLPVQAPPKRQASHNGRAVKAELRKPQGRKKR